MEVYQILEQLSKTTKRTEKEEILAAHKDNPVFLKVLHMALAPQYVYFMKDVPERVVDNGYFATDQEPLQLLTALQMIEDDISTRKKTGDEARRFVQDILGRVTDADADILERVIKKNLKVGVSVKTVNKAFGHEEIYESPYQRCSSANEKNFARITYPALCQLKLDGLFINVIVDNDEVTLITRQTKTIKIPSTHHLYHTLKNMIDNGNVVLGEMLILDVDNGRYFDREASNGIVNSSEFVNYLDNVRIICWDMISIQAFRARKDANKTPYNERFDALQQKIGNDLNLPIRVVDTLVVNSLEEAQTYFMDMLSQGQEGCVLKNLKGVWADNTSTDMVKMKDVREADLRVTGYSDAEKGSKYEGGIGSLIAQTECGECLVRISGMTDRQRGIQTVYDDNGNITGYEPIPGFDLEQYNDKIVAMKFNGITQDKETGLYSLYLPRTINDVAGNILFREDKTYADTLEELQQKKIGG